MTTPTTNLGLSSIQTEFGGSNPISLSEYYRGAGGGYVPSGQATSGTDGTAVSTSGAIRMGMFRGLTLVAGGIVASWSTNTTNVSLATGGRTVSFNLSGSGTTLRNNNSNLTNTAGPNWYSPTTSGIGTSYWVKATFTTSTAPSGSGNTTSGTFGSWINIGSGNVSWGWTTQNGQTEWAGDMTLQFSLSNGGSVIATGSVGFDVGYTP